MKNIFAALRTKMTLPDYEEETFYDGDATYTEVRKVEKDPQTSIEHVVITALKTAQQSRAKLAEIEAKLTGCKPKNYEEPNNLGNLFRAQSALAYTVNDIRKLTESIDSILFILKAEDEWNDEEE